MIQLDFRSRIFFIRLLMFLGIRLLATPTPCDSDTLFSNEVEMKNQIRTNMLLRRALEFVGRAFKLNFQ